MTPWTIVILNAILWSVASYGIYRYIHGVAETIRADRPSPIRDDVWLRQRLDEMDAKQQAFAESLRESQAKFAEESRLRLEYHLAHLNEAADGLDFEDNAMGEAFPTPEIITPAGPK